MTIKNSLIIAFALLAMGSAVFAAPSTEPEQAGMTVAEFEASLNYRQGAIDLPNGIAALDIPENFRYLGPEDAYKILVQAWGNPPGAETLGMIFPAETGPLDENGWGVVITYEEDGHVSDEDADSIDYGELLKEMQAGTAQANEQRRELGYEPVKLVGWATPPRYDPSTHKMYWAKEIQFGTSPQNTLNYNTRILGRKGVLVVNAVSGMHQLADIERSMKQVLAFTDFKSGQRYEDFDSGVDPVAAGGIAALVAGGIAAKTGLLAKLLPLLLFLKKFAVFIVIGIGALAVRLFKRKKT